jgi:hypothetical protein
VTATVVPHIYPRFYLPPAYYYRPYGPFPGDGVPITPQVPTTVQLGSVPLPQLSLGTVVTGNGSGLPQLALPQRYVSPVVAPQQFGGLTPSGGGEVDQGLQLLSSPKERDRMEAAIALGRGKVEKAIDPLQHLLASDTSARVREAAARALGLIGSPSSLKALANAAQGDDDRDVRHSAQFAAESIRANMR